MVSTRSRPKEAKGLRGIMLPGLLEARHSAALSLRELSEKSGKDKGRKIDQSTISEIERGIRAAQPRTARRLAELLKVEVDDLRRESRG